MMLADNLAETPMVVCVAPNGARKGKDDHPALPITADEIAATARTCMDAGAAMIHLHVRDGNGGHSLDPDIYREACAAVRGAVGDQLIIQVTSEAVGRYSPADQMAMVRAVQPEAVSLAIREIAPNPEDDSTVAAFLGWLVEEAGIVPQYILYSTDDVARFFALCDTGAVPKKARNLLLVLGRYATGQQSAPRDLLPLLGTLIERGSTIDSWGVCAFGSQENACALTAAALGGHPRVGFENNLRLADGSIAPDNASLVAQIRDGAAWLGRPLASAETARQILGAG